MEESYKCQNCGAVGSSRDVTGDGAFVCPQCGHRSAQLNARIRLPKLRFFVITAVILAGLGYGMFLYGTTGNDLERFLKTGECSGSDTEGWVTRAKGKQCDLRGADLAGAKLAGAKLYGANLHQADLSGANLRSADLQYSHLVDANLTGANLHGTDLTGADLNEANLDDVIGADFTGAHNVPTKYLKD